MAQQPKDFAGMMAGTPQASPSMAEPAAGGVSPTQTVAQADQIKEQLVAALEAKGVFNEATDQKQMQEIMQLVDQLVASIESNDREGILKNPILQLLGITPEQVKQQAGVAQKGMRKGMEQANQMSQTPPPGMGGGMPGGGMSGPGGM